MKDWSARQYTIFEEERTRPVRDLLARLPDAAVKTAVDIGCGPGNSTEELLKHFPHAAISGMDSSPDMIAAARKRLPSVSFEIGDLAAWQGAGNYGVILSNAVLQWLPDHESLLPRLIGRLAPGGSLAIQIPANLAEPAQTLMREVASAGPWKDRLAGAGMARHDRHDANWYYALLQDKVAKLDIWLTTYYHPLAGAAAIVEWFKSTGLRPFLNPLDEAEKAAFLEQYQAAVAKAYPPLADGTVLLPFPRLFFVATR